jgi:hypothetical protein
MSGTTAGGRGIHIRATGLFAETWFHRDPLAPLGAPAGNNFLAALGLHAHAKSVCLRSLAPVGLECTLGQSSSLLIPSTVLGQTVSINHAPHYRQTHKCLHWQISHLQFVETQLATSLSPRAALSTLRRVRSQTPRCTVSAAVTIALLDSTMQSGSEYPFAEKFLPNFSTQQKNLC